MKKSSNKSTSFLQNSTAKSSRWRRLRNLTALFALILSIGTAAFSANYTSFGQTIVGGSAAAFWATVIPTAKQSEAFAVADKSGDGARTPLVGGNLNTPRAGHTATPLDDGRILIVGGDANGTAEIYDPKSGVSTAVGNLQTPRVAHTATRLNDGRVLIAGGTNNGKTVVSTEIYDNGVFSSGPNLNAARAGQTATVLADGRILIVGGDAAGSLEILGAAAQKSQKIKTHLLAPRAFHTAKLLASGNLLIVGGASENERPVLSGEILNLQTMTFSEIGALHSARIRPLLRELPDGKVQIIGGNDEGSMEMFTPDGNRFSAFAHVIPGRDAAARRAFKNYAARGGAFNAAEEIGTTKAEAETMRTLTGAALINNGEAINSFLNRRDYALVEIPGANQILVTGGTDSAGEPLQNSIIFNRSDATVTTDQIDYPPGAVVTISGTGWEPGETIQLTLVRDPLFPENPNGIVLTAIADANGNFVNTDYMTTEDDLNTSFVLTALGLASGRTAQTTFTDARQASVTITPTAVTTGQNVTYTITITNTNTVPTTTNIGSVSILLPMGYGTPSIGTISSSTDTWTTISAADSAGFSNGYSSSTRLIGIKALNGSNQLANTESVSVQITTTAPGTAGSFEWTTNTYANLNLTGNTFTVPTQPSVTATAAACTAPTITTPPASMTKNVGESVTFSVTTSGTAPLSYQWRKGGVNISGATSNNYTISSVATGDAGNYDVVVLNSCGSATSTAATLTVNKLNQTITFGALANKTYGDANFNVSATASSGLTVSFAASGNCSISGATVQITGAGSCTITASQAGDATYNAAPSVPQTFNIAKATTTTTVTCSPTTVTYNGAAQTPCTVTVTGAGGLNLTPTPNYSNNTNAGTATASYTYSETATHLSSSDSKNFTINKAAATTTVSCPLSVTYNGAAQTPCTATVSGAGGLNQSLTVSYSNNTNAGTATASASYAETANYFGSSDSKNFTIAKAATTTTLTCPTNATYTGAAIEPCSATVTGAGGLNQTVAVIYANNVNAGTATATATYSESINHLGSSDSKTFTIDKAATTTTVTCPASIGYNGTAQTPCTATVSGAGLSQSLTVSYSNNTNAGTAAASANYAESANYLSSSDTKNFTINKAVTATVLTCPTNATYTGAAIEPCTATVMGAGGLSEAAAIVYANNVNAGTATATATYAETANYLGSSDNKNFTINKAATTTTVSCPSNVSYTGAELTPCTATVSGVNLNQSLTVNYGNNINAGTATATANYAETANYLSSSDSKTFTIDKAATTTTVSCPANVTFTGATLTPCTATVTGAGVNLTPTPNYSNNVNAGTATASYTFAGDENHNGSSDSKNFTIDKAATTTVLTCPASVTYTGSAIEPCSATVTGANLNASIVVAYADNTNAGTASATANFAETDNYLGSSDSKTFTINKAATTTTVTCPANVAYNGTAQTPCTATVTGANLSQSLTVNYSNNTNAGTASASAAFAETANYLGSSDSKSFTIDKAVTATVVTCPTSVTFTGSALTPCTATVMGAGSLNQTVVVTYADNTNAGTASATANFAETDNYLGSSDSKTFVINKAATTTTVSCPASVTYTGATLTPCTATVTGTSLNQSLTVGYADNVNAGTATASASYAETANYLGSSDNKTFTINKAATTIIVTCPANVTFTGTAQTPCTATVTGTGGLNQSLAVGYTDNTNAGTATATANFAETANYLSSSDSKTFTINKAATTTTVSCPASVTYTGAALTPCTATVTGAGGLNQSLTVGYGNNTNAGTATAGANYGETANYLGSSDNKTFTINKASSTTVVSGGGTYVFDGLPHPASVAVTGTGGLNLNPAAVYSGNCSAAPVMVAQTPCTASYTYAGDANHTGSSNSTVINITAFGTTTSVTVTPNSQQYSDKVTLTATIAPGFAGSIPAASTVTFFVGTQNMGAATLAAGTGGTLTATLANVALLETVAGQMSPGVKTVTAAFGGANPNFTVNNATAPLTITQENAAAVYSGAQYFATASSSSTTATITLSATVIDDSDGARGDIRKATVEFRRDTPTGTLLGSASPVGLVNSADSTVGTATTTFNYSLSGAEANAMGTTLTIYVVVKGYYTSISELANVSIVIPGTNSVNGGGFLTMQNSSGQFAGLTGSKMNFGYTMKYNNSGRNLQGQANIIVRGANGKVYQIKSNAVDSLAVTGTNYPKIGVFTTKANMKDITDPLNPVDLGGNLTLQVDMTDTATGGQTDKVGITLWNSAGGLYFTSNWSGTRTEQLIIGGGNISVR